MQLSHKSLHDLIESLDRFPRASLKRGRKYYAGGAVLELDCVDANREYFAVVQGSETYQVFLVYKNNCWNTVCSCPMQFDCKHCVAAMLELQVRAESHAQEAGAKAKPPKAPQPPGSPLYIRVVESLGRRPNSIEASFVKRIQSFYDNATYRGLSEGDLASIAGRPAYGWNPVKLWGKSHPKDDYYFWLHLAWEFRKRKWSIPDFMEPITQLDLIEPSMKEWERAEEIERWKDRFREFAASPTHLETAPMELRLLVLPDEARLQWRTGGASQFADVKQSHAKRFAEQFERGELKLTPESLPLWSATFKPWHYESWWTFKYQNGTSRPGLNRLLRMPLLPDRIVDQTGQPFARWTDKLRYELRSSENGEGNYRLSLVKPDGSKPAGIFCTLGDAPTLYLTSEGLFEGPSAGPLGNAVQTDIPAPAIETADGIRFLTGRGVPLPESMRARVRTMPVRVTVKCALTPIYPGSPSEDIVISIAAEAPGMAREELTPQGWQADSLRPKLKSESAEETVVIHDRSAQMEFPLSLETLGAKWSGYPNAWHVRLTRKTPELFVSWLKTLPPQTEILLDKQLATLRDEPVSGTIALDVSETAIDWFDLKVELKITDTTLTPEELKLLLNARGGYVRLGKKGWRRLQFNLTPDEDEQLARLGLNPRDLTGEPQRFHALQLADEAAKRFLGPDRIERIQRRVSELKTRVSPPLPKQLRVEMRPYQTDGFHFLAYLGSNRFGGVLADDMGLGKTIQALAWVAWLRDETPSPLPSLVVCPKSVMDNWRGEADRFYPGLRVRLWRGEIASELAAARESNDLIVVNYSQLRSLLPAITDAQWHATILDEAQYIKNPDSQTAQAARALKAEYRLALTGTPIENRLLDLWSIMAFAMPGALGNRSHFLKRFDAKDDPLARRRLAARVRPFLLRRTKAQVAKDLPDRVEEDLLCEMEGEQKTLYRAELKKARQLILGLKTNKQLNDERFNVLTSLLRLRQICCHPALVDQKLRQAESAKVAALEDVLESLMEEGHKVLVFSQFVTMLDILRQTAKERGWREFYLAGETENRGELVKEFQTAQGSAVFFISLKAGGFGLNLTAASYVVLFDPWWNPAVENQAIDRTHRIGQTSKVMAYRLLMRDSVEQKIRELQKRKSSLAEDVLGEERFAQSLTLDDLKFLFAE